MKKLHFKKNKIKKIKCRNNALIKWFFGCNDVHKYRWTTKNYNPATQDSTRIIASGYTPSNGNTGIFSCNLLKFCKYRFYFGKKKKL